MSKASNQADAGAETRVERLQHWLAVFLSALLHLLLLLLAMLSPPIVVAPPQGAAAGSRMAVDFIGATPPQPITLPTRPTPASKPAVKSRAASRVQTTPVPRADDPMPPDDPDEAAQEQAQPPASAPPTPQRPQHIWGQPPGMLPQDTAPENAGLARSPAINPGRSNGAATGESSMEVGGYQVYYDLRAEARLRAWRDGGMTEIFLPLPGARQYMVCPLETALRRESGACRLVDPGAPEMKAIGDARDVIDMQKVYRRGEVVWSGPGPYR